MVSMVDPFQESHFDILDREFDGRNEAEST